MPVCCMCHQDRPASDVAFGSLATGELQSHCRTCHAAYRRQHYLDSRDVHIAREVARINDHQVQNRVLVYRCLFTHPCVDRGETDVVVLELDHRHRRRTAERFGWTRRSLQIAAAAEAAS